MSDSQPDAATSAAGPAAHEQPGVVPAYQLGEQFKQLQDANIMMVDDETITLKVMRTLLEYAGYRRFILVDDAACAMDQLREARPDVLLLDVVMPGLSGFDILKLIRQDRDFAHLPVIILTSSVDANTKLQALDLGATDFLSKPVDASELALRVRNTLAAKAYQDRLSYYDVLTHLPNQHLFHERMKWAIERAQQKDHEFALLYLSFGDLKRVTETFGPAVGDQAIRQLAERLKACVHPSDSVSPIAAEEYLRIDLFHLKGSAFAILVRSEEVIMTSSVLAKRILESMKLPIDADGSDVYLAPSIGVASFPRDAGNETDLFKLAAGASGQAAAEGGGRMQFYSQDMNLESVQRLQLEAGLRSALENNEFSLVYQPKVESASGQCIGGEALIRWHRPTGDSVSPDVFIPVAEETGLILSIGEWVLREACDQLVLWQQQGLSLKLSVNVSAVQFFHPGFVTLVKTVIDEKGIEGKWLTLEITESFLLNDNNQAREVLGQLRAVGVELSIDDFGTGYCSLSYLKNFRAQELKLDRSFITDVANCREDQALVYAATDPARELGMRVCAEGVEDEAQLAYLQKIQCDQFQGYYFSPPVSPDEFLATYHALNQSGINRIEAA